MKNKILSNFVNIICLEFGIVCGIVPCTLLYLCYIEFDYYTKYFTLITRNAIVISSLVFFVSHGLVLALSLIMPKIAWKFNDLRPLRCFLYSLFFAISFFCITGFMELRYIKSILSLDDRNTGNVAGSYTAMVLPFIIYLIAKYLIRTVLEKRTVKLNNCNIE